MQKQTQLSEMPVAVLIITIVVMLGLLLGVLYYFAANVTELSPSVLVVPVKQEITIKTDKTEYEQGEAITATLDYKDYKGKIYQWDKYAWSIQKLEDNKWVNIQKRGDPAFFCSNIPECKDVNLETIEECPSLIFCERSAWYEVVGAPELAWDQSYKVEEKAFSCNFIQSHPITKEITSSELENRSCAVFVKAQHGNYKIRFEYATDIDIDDPFNKEIDVKYVEKEFTIKEKTAVDPRCGQKVRITGICEGKLIDDIGYEFNSKIGRCNEKVIGGNGCRIETPFNSLEKCQKTCEEQQDFYSCSQDSDCIKIDGDCCGCSAGGKSISINKNYEKEWQSKLSEECKDLDCPAVMSDDPSCFAEPRCADNKCVLE